MKWTVIKSPWFKAFSTFRARIFWSVIPIVLVLFLLLGGISLWWQRGLAEEEFMKRGQAMAANLASSSELGVLAEDSRLLTSAMRGVVGDPDVAFVFIYREDGKILVKGGTQVGALTGLSAEQNGRRFVEFSSPILSEPVKTAEELLIGPLGQGPGQAQEGRQRPIGTVRIGLSLQSVEMHVMALLKLWGGLTVVFLALSTVAIYAFSRRITRPIKQLTDEAEKIAAGQRSVKVEIDSRDEIGRLANSFNEMVASLEENEAALKRKVVETRTLYEIGQEITAQVALEPTLRLIVEQARALLQAEVSLLALRQEKSDTFAMQASSGTISEGLAGVRFRPGEGLGGRVVVTGMPIVVGDYLEEYPGSPFLKILEESGLRSAVAVPLKARDVVIGVLYVHSRAPQQFLDEDRQLLSALAAQAALAIEQARLYEAATQQAKRWEGLYRLGALLSRSLEVEEVYTAFAEAVKVLVPYDRIGVVVPEGKQLRMALSVAEPPVPSYQGAVWAQGEATAVGSVLAHKTSRLVRDLATEATYSDETFIAREGVRATVQLPLVAAGEGVGVLLLDSRTPGAYTERDLELLDPLAQQLALALQNARLYAQIKDHAEELEQRVDERTQELQTANLDLEAASRHKSQFLANMSHELRTPLNAILGYTELILDKIYGEVPETIRDVLERVDKNGHHLLGLINDVLDISKIEAGELSLSLNDYSMKEVAQTVFTAVESLATEKKLALKVTVPPDLPLGRGDERRIAQVLLNLVGNAIKFTEVGEVRIQAQAADGAFLVSVSDTGPGIALGDQQKIFEEFQQVDDSTTKTKGGTGLGLAIAKRIIEMHGGRIWVESTAGQGSIFWFTVPVRVDRQTERT